MAVVFDIYTDFICPWCYLGSARTDRLAREYDVELRVNYFPLHPGLPAEGIPLSKLFAGRNIDIGAIHARLSALLDAEGLPFTPSERVCDTRLAQELAKWAQSERGTALEKRFYKAYFVDGDNLGDPDVLVRVAVEQGLPEAEVRAVLTDRTWRAAIDADWQRSRGMGITGVPTYVMGRRGVVGAQPYEVLARLAEDSGARRRA
jgi:predicted DsbA family dithiol-disulfide isomerase